MIRVLKKCDNQETLKIGTGLKGMNVRHGFIMLGCSSNAGNTHLGSIQDEPDHREKANYSSQGKNKVFTRRLKSISQQNYEELVKVKCPRIAVNRKNRDPRSKTMNYMEREI